MRDLTVQGSDRRPRTGGGHPAAGVTRSPRAATVGLLLFEGCDVLDVTGPYDVLLTANRLVERDGGDPPFAVRTFSIQGGSVTGFGGLGLVPASGALGGAEELDVLIVPGLIDLDAIAGMDDVVSAVADAARSTGVLAAVCTGSFLLQAAGLLGEDGATTHWEDVDALAELRGTGTTRGDVRWVDAGRVVTSGGMTSGIAMTLHLVERLVDHALAVRTAAQIDYVWTEHRG